MLNSFELLLWVAYLLIGPVLWIGALIVSFAERRRMLRLEVETDDLPQPPPLASVLIPVRNEADGIATCIRSVLSQDYPALEVIAVDDRSTDSTGRILDELAASDFRLQVVHIASHDFPEGWMGKNYALHRGAQIAQGQWLLCIDSDLELSPTALLTLIARAQSKGTDLVSLIPRIEAENFWERLILPLAGWVGSFLDRTLREPVAYGWLMLFRRSAYDAIGGHASVRNTMGEDLAIARRMKEAGFRPRIWWGTHLASLRMNRPLVQILKGLARNFYAISPPPLPKRTLLGIAMLLGIMLGFAVLIAGIASGSAAWMVAGLIHLSAVICTFAATYRWTVGAAWLALLLPLSTLLMLFMFCWSLWMSFRGKVEWRGSVIESRPATSKP